MWEFSIFYPFYKKQGPFIRIALASFLIFFLGYFVSASFSAEPEQTDQSRLKSLKIQTLKRKLRLPGPLGKITNYHAGLMHLYDENRFSEIVQLPPGEENVRIFFLYGNSFFSLNRMEKAVSAYQQAFRLASSAEEKSAAMANFGLVFSASGRLKEAIIWLEKALEVDRGSDNWPGQGMTLSLLGSFYYQVGETEKGAAAHIESLEIAETIPMPWLEARQLGQMGKLYYLDGTLHLAQNYFQKAVGIYVRQGDPLGEAEALTALSFVHKDLEQFDKALALQEKAFSIYRTLNDLTNKSKVLLNMSLIHRDQGFYLKALDLAEKSLQIQKSVGNLQHLAEIEGTMGTIYEKEGRLVEAISHLQTARDYFIRAGASQQIHIVDLRIQALEDQIQ